ncbi:uncharacterized protein LOC110845119 [Folsomia candida]|uniref:uncharacterized protein LOC110845119 n=1 Tax=Folsomia candida TaxID=158441 RepID=UPI0016053A14|nr:uncharacterized protein LOC110845119 [Folsomia candida]
MWSHHELHPLFNELTLSKILSNLSLPDLLECRLVCQTWATNPEIMRRMGDEVTICLNTYPILDKFIQFITEWDDLLGNNASFPFKRFDFHFTVQCHPLCDSAHALSESEAEAAALGKGKLAQLFQKMKDSSSWLRVKFLKLTLDKTHLAKDGLQSLLLSNPSVTEHLETLHIYNLSHRAVFSQGFLPSFEKAGLLRNLRTLIMDEIRIPITEFMSDFLSQCGNLEEIVLKCDKRSDWENQKGIWKEHSPLATSFIKGLVQICQNKASKLRVMRCGILDLTHFLLLTQLGAKGLLRLTHLEMYCPAKDVSPDVVRDFLETQATSLRVLRVLGNVDKLRRAVGNNSAGNQKDLSPEFVLVLPEKMDVLTEFQLSGRDKDTPIPVKSLCFNSVQFPYLTSLIVCGFATNLGDRMDDYFPPVWRMMKVNSYCGTLRKLVLPAEIRDSEFPARVVQLFPNVTELEVKYPNSDFLSAVFKSFRKLASLIILAESSLSIERGMIGDDHSDGIDSLTRLKSLKITVETEHHEVPSALTDQVAYAALVRMKTLRKLVLISCCWFDGPFSCNFFSQKCRQDLVQEMENCVIIFTPLEKTTCCLENSGETVAEFYGS